jgi:hypothetical protein
MALESVLILTGEENKRRYGQRRGEFRNASAGLLNECRPGLSNGDGWVEYETNAYV